MVDGATAEAVRVTAAPGKANGWSEPSLGLTRAFEGQVKMRGFLFLFARFEFAFLHSSLSLSWANSWSDQLLRGLQSRQHQVFKPDVSDRWGGGGGGGELRCNRGNNGSRRQSGKKLWRPFGWEMVDVAAVRFSVGDGACRPPWGQLTTPTPFKGGTAAPERWVGNGFNTLFFIVEGQNESAWCKTEDRAWPLPNGSQNSPLPPELFKLRGIKHHKIGVTWQTAAGLCSSSDLKSAAGSYKSPSINFNYKGLESVMLSAFIAHTRLHS